MMVAHDIPNSWAGSCDDCKCADCFFNPNNKARSWKDGKKRMIKKVDDLTDNEKKALPEKLKADLTDDEENLDVDAYIVSINDGVFERLSLDGKGYVCVNDECDQPVYCEWCNPRRLGTEARGAGSTDIFTAQAVKRFASINAKWIQLFLTETKSAAEQMQFNAANLFMEGNKGNDGKWTEIAHGKRKSKKKPQKGWKQIAGIAET